MSANDANTTYAANAAYTPGGALATLALGGGNINLNQSFSSRLQPSRIQALSATGTDLLDLAYDFGLGAADNGNVLTIANLRDATRTQSFAYDALNRVVLATTPAGSPQNAWGQAFGYDPWGNLLVTALTQGAAPSSSVSVNGQNQIVGYCYDPAGNLLDPNACPSGNTPHSYAYNAEGQMVSALAAAYNYTYDGDGKRVQKSRGKLYWYGTNGEVLTETDLSGSVTDDYVFFGGKRLARVDASSNVDYYFSDQLGSSRVVTDATGNVLDDSDFYPFGWERPVTSGSGNTYKFTGKERDTESGNDYFGARYYSSSIGRFMSPDQAADETISVPLPFADLRNPQSLNLYCYGLNNPVSNVDPDGHDVHVCVDNGNGGQNCSNMSDQGYANLQQQQNGQNGINMPGGPFPNGTITCGGEACGSATYFEPGLQDTSVDFALFAAGAVSLGRSLLESGLDLLRGAAGGIGESVAKEVIASGGKAAIRDALENGAVNELQKQAVKRALARGAASDTFTLEKLADGSIKITTEVAGRAGGRALYEKVIDAAGQTTSVVQKAYDASGNLVHVDPKLQ